MKLFDPVELGPLRLRNRVVMAPMTRRFSPGGVPPVEVGDYYVRRAEGGVGMIMTEGLDIGPGSVHQEAIPHFHGPAALAAWERIARRVQAAGAAFVPQFWHVGGARPDGLSPSGVYTPGRPYGEPASQDEIDAVVAAYAAAAAAASAMGCDGIEIHAGHGYLVDQFLWSGTNDRTDRYGGGIEGRTRFAAEVVAACRSAAAPDFPIFFRFSQWKIQDYTARLFATPAELERFLRVLVRAGVDVFDCSTRRFADPEFTGSDLSLAAWTRTLSGRPVMAVGSVGLDNDVVATVYGGAQTSGVAGLEDLDRMLELGHVDLVGVGRALLADAEWPTKIRAGERPREFTRAVLEVLA